MIASAFKSKILLVASVLLAGSLCMTSRASAGVFPSFSVSPSSILEGGTSTLHLHLDLFGDLGSIDADFASGSVTLFSGQGLLGEPSMTFAVGPSGLMGIQQARDFSATFTYPMGGVFLPSFLGEVFYDDIFPDGSRERFRFSLSGSAELNVVAATPLPAALPLLGSGLGLMGFVGWWRKRRVEAAA